jgi:hypothetical protein
MSICYQRGRRCYRLDSPGDLNQPVGPARNIGPMGHTYPSDPQPTKIVANNPFFSHIPSGRCSSMKRIRGCREASTSGSRGAQGILQFSTTPGPVYPGIGGIITIDPSRRLIRRRFSVSAETKLIAPMHSPRRDPPASRRGLLSPSRATPQASIMKTILSVPGSTITMRSPTRK